MAAPRGRVSLFAGLPKDAPTITLDSNRVHYRELSVVGAAGSTPAHNAAALGLIASGEVPVQGPHHPSSAARAGARGDRRCAQRRGHQVRDRAMTSDTAITQTRDRRLPRRAPRPAGGADRQEGGQPAGDRADRHEGAKGPVDARSALLLMTLGAGHGDEVVVEAERRRRRRGAGRDRGDGRGRPRRRSRLGAPPCRRVGDSVGRATRGPGRAGGAANRPRASGSRAGSRTGP